MNHEEELFHVARELAEAFHVVSPAKLVALAAIRGLKLKLSMAKEVLQLDATAQVHSRPPRSEGKIFASRPNVNFAADLMDFSKADGEHKYAVQLTDNFTRETYCMAIKTKGAADVNAAMKELVREAHLPEKAVISTDSGPEFRHLDEAIPSIIHRTKDVNDRNALGIGDSVMGILKRNLAIAMGRRGGSWATHLADVTYSFNHTPMASIHGAPVTASGENAQQFAILKDQADKFGHNLALANKRSDELTKSAGYFRPATFSKRAQHPQYGPVQKAVRTAGAYVVNDQGIKTLRKHVKAVLPNGEPKATITAADSRIAALLRPYILSAVEDMRANDLPPMTYRELKARYPELQGTSALALGTRFPDLLERVGSNMVRAVGSGGYSGEGGSSSARPLQIQAAVKQRFRQEPGVLKAHRIPVLAAAIEAARTPKTPPTAAARTPTEGASGKTPTQAPLARTPKTPLQAPPTPAGARTPKTPLQAPPTPAGARTPRTPLQATLPAEGTSGATPVAGRLPAEGTSGATPGGNRRALYDSFDTIRLPTSVRLPATPGGRLPATPGGRLPATPGGRLPATPANRRHVYDAFDAATLPSQTPARQPRTREETRRLRNEIAEVTPEATRRELYILADVYPNAITINDLHALRLLQTLQSVSEERRTPTSPTESVSSTSSSSSSSSSTQALVRRPRTREESRELRIEIATLRSNRARRVMMTALDNFPYARTIQELHLALEAEGVPSGLGD